jgi:hypothetical protein
MPTALRSATVPVLVSAKLVPIGLKKIGADERPSLTAALDGGT